VSKFVYKNGKVTINGVDLSDHVRNCQITLAKDEVEDTGLNGPGLHTFIPGLANERFVITFASDFDAAMVDATLYPLYRNETVFPVSVNPFAGANSATNPQYNAHCNLYTYDPINAAVGALAESQVTFIATEAITPKTT
jgi:hypothetical protein